MAHWAEIDETNEVVRVVVADADKYDWLIENLGGEWVETFKDRSARGNYAAPGFTYDEALDAFISPKPSETAILDETTFQWVEPEIVDETA